MNGNENLCSKKVIADLLNLSERRIEQLVAKRILPKVREGSLTCTAP